MKELIDEFKNGMKRIYEDEIQFKDLDEEELTFCEWFSNLLYNILLIIDHQKQFINQDWSKQKEVSEDTEEEDEDLPKENKTVKVLQEEFYK